MAVDQGVCAVVLCIRASVGLEFLIAAVSNQPAYILSARRNRPPS